MQIRSEKTINKQISMLNRKNIITINQVPSMCLHNYNCWGFVKALFTDCQFKWIQCYSQMEKWLNHYTRIVSTEQRKTGDIVCFRNNSNELTHTAILLNVGKNTLLHKPGRAPLEISDIYTVTEARSTYYDYGLLAETRRYIP